MVYFYYMIKEHNMNNMKYSKCPRCNGDEKYVVHLLKDGKEIKIMVCSKECMLNKKEKAC